MNKPVAELFSKPVWEPVVMGMREIILEVSTENYNRWLNYGEGTDYTKDCHCTACDKIRSLFHPTPDKIILWPSGGWCDPRRGYHESEEDFIKRVPDGILRWPQDHIPPKNVL